LRKGKAAMNKFAFKPSKDIDKAGQTNEVRSRRADQAIRDGFKIRGKDELDLVNASGLLSDIFHLCDCNGWNVTKVIRIAKANWQDER
jgi:hypothetical protein